ncbi:hypothetical protein H4Q26_013515 [Puccinia striiformis f. sp. tritici PST-130]|nr:hypothetical protein H4Q26_013515 [Puccinia striiformis f. sp. tritici PST-130]
MASSASFLLGRDGLLSTQSLKNPNDVRTDRLTTCILSERQLSIILDPPLLGIRINHNNDCPGGPLVQMEFLDTSMLDDEYGDFNDSQESRLGPSPPVPGQRQFMPLFDFNTQGEATSGPFDTQGNPINPGYSTQLKLRLEQASWPAWTSALA